MNVLEMPKITGARSPTNLCHGLACHCHNINPRHSDDGSHYMCRAVSLEWVTDCDCLSPVQDSHHVFSKLLIVYCCAITTEVFDSPFVLQWGVLHFKRVGFHIIYLVKYIATHVIPAILTASGLVWPQMQPELNEIGCASFLQTKTSEQ